MTVAALSVVFCPQELQRALDVSKPFKGSDLHLHGDVMLEVSRGLVGRVRIQFRGRFRGKGEIGAGEQHRALPDEFLPQVGSPDVQWRCSTAGHSGDPNRLLSSRSDGVRHWLFPFPE